MLVIDAITKIFGKIQQEIELLQKSNKLDSHSLPPKIKIETVKSTLTNSYSSLKNLNEFDQFVDVLRIFENMLLQYQSVLDNYGVAINELEKIKNELENHISEIEKEPKNFQTEGTEKEYFQLDKHCKNISHSDTTWFLCDRFNAFTQITKNKVIEQGWQEISGKFYQINGDYKEIQSTLEFIHIEDFVEYYQVIGISNGIMKKRFENSNEKKIKNIPIQFLENGDFLQRIVSDALHLNDESSIETLIEELRKKGNTKEKEFWNCYLEQ